MTGPLSFARTLKNDWKTVARTDGRGVDILAAHCHPDFDAPKDRRDPPFVVVYERYTFDGARRFRKQRREAGFWEAEDGAFPPADRFPP